MTYELPGYPREVETVAGVTAIKTDSFNRPADANQYADGDAISDSTTTPTLLEFEAARVNGGSGTIVKAVLISSSAPGTLLQADLWLFDRPVTAMEDNAAADPSDTELTYLIGVYGFTLEAFKASDNSADESDSGDVKPFVAQPNTKKIYGVLVARNTYTPVSGETFTVRLGIYQD